MSLEMEARRFIRAIESDRSKEFKQAAYQRFRKYIQTGIAAEQHVGTDACIDCRGTGKWANGMDCMRCTGKGYQTMADKRRNANYDRSQGAKL